MHSKPRSVVRVRPGEVVDLDALLPGDIILSRPATWESFWIAKFGRSEFSHASLAVSEDIVRGPSTERGPRDGLNNFIIEATTEKLPWSNEIVGGVGYAELHYKWIRKRGSSDVPRVRVFALNDYAYFEVFRHRAFESVEFHSFTQHRIASLCDQYLDKPYARLVDLAKVSIAPWLVNLIGNRFIDLPKSLSGGPFCSQLIAGIYRDGGFALSAKEPSVMRPEDLAKAPDLDRITAAVRRQVLPNEELVGDLQLVEETFPGLLSGVTDSTRLEAIFPEEGVDSDFQGRLVKWLVRDRVETGRQQLEKVTGVLRKFKRGDERTHGTEQKALGENQSST